ncbi:hypothetical protein [Bacillus sp. Brlt_9]|uniref:hypothetical protein n=1 Tax=Bacillus sp. Brlt_9 TaxID=3110916 RepID=UPI003F7BD661
MAKDKIPGDNVIWRLKKNERKGILDWVNAQTNVTDAIRFLVEADIEINGIRNLAEETPSKRSDEFFENYIDREISRLINLRNLLAGKSNKETLMISKHQEISNNNFIKDEVAATQQLPRVEEKVVEASPSETVVSDEKPNHIEIQSEAIEVKEEYVASEKNVEVEEKLVQEEKTVQEEKQDEPVTVVEAEKVETTASKDSSKQIEVAKNSVDSSKKDGTKKKKVKAKVNLAAISKSW